MNGKAQKGIKGAHRIAMKRMTEGEWEWRGTATENGQEIMKIGRMEIEKKG